MMEFFNAKPLITTGAKMWHHRILIGHHHVLKEIMLYHHAQLVLVNLDPNMPQQLSVTQCQPTYVVAGGSYLKCLII